MDKQERIRELIQQFNSDYVEIRSKAYKELIKIGKPAVPELVEILRCDVANRARAANWLGTLGKPAVPALIYVLKDESKYVRAHAAKELEWILKNCKRTEDIVGFEDKLVEGLTELRKKCRDKRKLKRIEFLITELKMKAAEMKNELAEKKDILLPDKPKPPKKGQMYRQLRRLRNG